MPEPFDMIVVDIDGTIFESEKHYCSSCGRSHYFIGKENTEQIRRINEKYDAGVIVILHTARGWDLYLETKAQLFNHGVKYSELVMGKPGGAIIDADARSMA